MSIAEKAAALLEALTPNDVAALPPVQRRRFADLARRVAALADPQPEQPKAGVLVDLRGGRQA